MGRGEQDRDFEPWLHKTKMWGLLPVQANLSAGSVLLSWLLRDSVPQMGAALARPNRVLRNSRAVWHPSMELQPGHRQCSIPGCCIPVFACWANFWQNIWKLDTSKCHKWAITFFLLFDLLSFDCFYIFSPTFSLVGSWGQTWLQWVPHMSHLQLPLCCARALEQTLAVRPKEMLRTKNTEIKPRKIHHFPYALRIKLPSCWTGTYYCSILRGGMLPYS